MDPMRFLLLPIFGIELSSNFDICWIEFVESFVVRCHLQFHLGKKLDACLNGHLWVRVRYCTGFGVEVYVPRIHGSLLPK